jgi:hypothetical protein
MFKKTVIGVCGLFFAAALSIPAFADQSIGYQKYFNEGVKAFKDNDDQEALRCFKIAQIYDPADEELNRYIDILEKKGVTIELPPSASAPEESAGYKYYLAKGVEAYRNHETSQAVHYFNLAIIFNPDSQEADNYLRLLSQKVSFPEENQPRPLTAVAQPAYVAPVEQPIPQKQPEEQSIAQQQLQPPEQPQPSAVVPEAYLCSAISPKTADPNLIVIPDHQ